MPVWGPNRAGLAVSRVLKIFWIRDEFDFLDRDLFAGVHYSDHVFVGHFTVGVEEDDRRIDIVSRHEKVQLVEFLADGSIDGPV